MSILSERVAGIKPSATLVIDTLAKKMLAHGEDVISFAAGEPDFNPPQVASYAAISAIEHSAAINKYSNVAGQPDLRRKVTDLTNGQNSTLDFTADDCIITNGGKEAVFLALATLINPGDEVLLPTPAWLTYTEVISFFGAKTVEILGTPTNSYKVTPELLQANFTPKSKVLLLNTPVNPTGAVYSEAELLAIANWALERGITVISDEIYEYLIYGELYSERASEGKVTAPHILEVCPQLSQQCVIINGVAKSYAMTGWRLGWAIGSSQIIKGMTKLKGHLSSNTNNLAQITALTALEEGVTERIKMRDAFAGRSQLIVELLGQIEDLSGHKLKVPPPEGAFYAFCDISEFIGVPLGNTGKIAQNSDEFAQIILAECKVAIVPMDAFGITNHIRLSYALGEAQITEGITRLIKFFQG